MKRLALRAVVAVGTTAALAMSLAACSSGGQASTDGKVTITVGDRPTADQKAQLKQYNEDIAGFEKANPDITLEPKTVTWNPTTFDAQLAGGSLPDVLSVAFTEAKSLIANKQSADITAALKSTGVDKIMGATTKKLVSADGKTYAVPTTAYSIGLVYNRALFTKAGLDPDKPPTTWDEVRADAKKITDATGQAGYANFGSQNQGGWMLTAISYSYGGRVESNDGKTATFDNAQTEKALTTIHEMKSEDGSVAANALYTQDTLYKDFAAGKVGMMISAPDAYTTVVQNNGMDAKDFGVGGMPLASGGSSAKEGTLTGGSIQIVNPKTDSAQQEAAVKWIAYHYLRQYQSEKEAVTVATATADSGNPVGVPALAVVSSSTYDQYNGWIKDQINVPQENFAEYTKSESTIPIIPEPSNDAQEVYAALDTVMQSALTSKSFDAASVLSKAKTSVDAKLGR